MNRVYKLSVYREIAMCSDAQLEALYFDVLNSCLGSKAERMEELGYEGVDVCEQHQLEKYNGERLHMIEECCLARGIKLFELEASDELGI